MNRNKAIVLLLIMLVNGCGFYFYYAIQLQEIRYEMRKALAQRPDNELELLVLSRNEYLSSRVDDHEIRFHDRMYDIARVEFINDRVKIFCLHDELEDNLLAFLQQLVAKPLKNKNSIPNAVFQFLTLVFIIPSIQELFNYQQPSENITRYNFSVTDFLMPDIAHPPKPAA